MEVAGCMVSGPEMLYYIVRCPHKPLVSYMLWYIHAKGSVALNQDSTKGSIALNTALASPSCPGPYVSPYQLSYQQAPLYWTHWIE